MNSLQLACSVLLMIFAVGVIHEEGMAMDLDATHFAIRFAAGFVGAALVPGIILFQQACGNPDNSSPMCTLSEVRGGWGLGVPYFVFSPLMSAIGVAVVSTLFLPSDTPSFYGFSVLSVLGGYVGIIVGGAISVTLVNEFNLFHDDTPRRTIFQAAVGTIGTALGTVLVYSLLVQEEIDFQKSQSEKIDWQFDLPIVAFQF